MSKCGSITGKLYEHPVAYPTRTSNIRGRNNPENLYSLTYLINSGKIGLRGTCIHPQNL